MINSVDHDVTMDFFIFRGNDGNGKRVGFRCMRKEMQYCYLPLRKILIQGSFSQESAEELVQIYEVKFVYNMPQVIDDLARL